MYRPLKRTIVGSLAAALLLAGCGKDRLPSAPGSSSSTVDLVRRGPGGTTRFLARNVLYRLDANISMFLSDMNADVVLKDPSLPFVPANKSDFSMQIHHAVVDKDAASLTALMNNYVFNDADSPLRNLTISYKGAHLVMKGEMKQVGLWNGFEMEGALDPTPDGMIRMTPVMIKAKGVRVDGLLNLFGIEMSKLMKTKEEKGVIMHGNEILMDPARLYPPPTLIGRVTLVGIRNNRLHIEFDDGKAKPWPADMYIKDAPACLLMWGGDVLINSALNLNAKMQIIDSTPATPMIFALDKYREQLEAGFVVPTTDGGMIAYVPDITNYDQDLGRYAPSFPVPGIKVAPPDAALNGTDGLPHR
jgi:hypothetical protein